MEHKNIFVNTIQKTIKAIIVGVSCFFVGILLAALSPLIAILSLVHKPQKSPPLTDRWGKGLKKLEKKIKEAQDPDSQQPWKKRHLDLYGTENDESSPSES